MKVSNLSSFSGAEYESFSESKAWTLSSVSGDGTKTVYVIFKNPLGNESEVYTDTIIYDSTQPVSFGLNSPSDKSYTSSDRPSFKWNVPAVTDVTSGLSNYSLEVYNGDSGSFSLDNIPTNRTTDYETTKYRAVYENFSDSVSDNNYITVYTKSSSDWNSDANSGNNDGKLKEGKRYWKVKATDNARNERSETWTLFVDKTPPNISITSIGGTAVSGESLQLQNQKPTIYGEVTDNLSGDKTENKIASGPKSIQIEIDKKNSSGSYEHYTTTSLTFSQTYWLGSGNVITDNSVNTDGKIAKFTFTPADSLPFGDYRVKFVAKDNADNSSETTVSLNIVTAQSQTTQATQQTTETVREETPPVQESSSEERNTIPYEEVRNTNESENITSDISPSEDVSISEPKQGIIEIIIETVIKVLTGIGTFFNNLIS